MSDYSIAAKRIAELRKELDLSQTELGEKVGVKKGTVSLGVPRLQQTVRP